MTKNELVRDMRPGTKLLGRIVRSVVFRGADTYVVTFDDGCQATAPGYYTRAELARVLGNIIELRDAEEDAYG